MKAFLLFVAVMSCFVLMPLPEVFGESFNFEKARLVVSQKPSPGNAEAMARTVFLEEFEKRCGYAPAVSGRWPDEDTPVIALGTRETLEAWPHGPGSARLTGLENLEREGYLLWLDEETRAAPTLWVLGADGRGALYGVGKLLRKSTLTRSQAFVDGPIDILSQPVYAIRGHQLGYRNRANSWDAWTYHQFEQYIRDLVIFGANAIENIPFQDSSTSPLMRYDREEFNVTLGEICAKYDVDHWVWTPIEFDLNDTSKHGPELRRHEDLYKSTPRLDAVFVPGGDPGGNPARLVLPFIEKLAEMLQRYHPRAKVWLSMQKFGPSDQDDVYAYLKDYAPQWFGGIVHGPSSPSLKETRRRLPEQYAIRHYPDITHTVRCQYPVPQWDRVFNLTLGREGVNYRPRASKHLHNWFAAYTDGFISYSDGVHDDVNKIIWTLSSWDPLSNVREGLIEYGRYFIDPELAQQIADGILALEGNWEGPISENGNIDGTLSLWRELERSAPRHVLENWRFQMALFRAYYDAYQKHRLPYEETLEEEARAVLTKAGEIGSVEAVTEARAILAKADGSGPRPDLRSAVFRLAEALFQSVQLQTSMDKYHASGPERGCSLDFATFPLNNRNYYEFIFAGLPKLASEGERVASLMGLAQWENPGSGGYYDDVGNISQSPHVILGEGWYTDPLMRRNPNPGFSWANGGNDARRLAWQDGQRVLGMRYEGLQENSDYRVVATVRSSHVTLVANGVDMGPGQDLPLPPMPSISGKFGGGILMKAWDVPHTALAADVLELQWETVRADGRVARPALAEVWLKRVTISLSENERN